MTSVDRTVDHMKDEAANFPDPADRASRKRNSPSNCATGIVNAS